MDKIHDLIDTKNPIWVELCETVKVPEYRDAMRSSDAYWYSYIKYFTKDQLALFIEAFPNAIKFMSIVITNILRNIYVVSESIKLLDSLTETWGCDYSAQEYDYIKLCLEMSDSASVYDIIKYFLEHGVMFQKHHIPNALLFGEKMMQLMLDNGVELDDIATIFCQKFCNAYPTQFANLKFLFGTGIDLFGYIDKTEKTY
jgi:hypothetical protein